MNKRSAFVLLILSILVSSLILAACSSTETTTSPTSSPAPTTTTKPPVQPIELKLASLAPPTHKSAVATYEYMANEMEKRSDGRVKITIYWSASLAPPPGVYDAVLKGTCDIGEAVANYNPGRFPASEISDLPLGYPDALTTARALNDWYNEFTPPEWDDVKVLFLSGTPPTQIGTANKAVRTLDDIKGQTIRVPGAMVANIIEAMGAVPRPMPVTEVYEAMSKSVIEGVAISIEAYMGFKLHEVVKYATDMQDVAWSSLLYTVMNKDSWNKLGAEDQKLLEQISMEAMELRAKMQDEDQETIKGIFLGMPGREYITLSQEEMEKFRDISQTIINAYISDMDAIGLPGATYIQYMQDKIK